LVGTDTLIERGIFYARLQNPFFFIFPAATRHQCVYMMAWLIFKPLSLVGFLTGGNNQA
jgi:hypothetical protein